MRIAGVWVIAGLLAGCGAAPAPAPAGNAGATGSDPAADVPQGGSGAGADVVADEPALPAPDFTLPDLAGEPVTLSALRGKVVLLAFWSVD